MVQDFVHPQYGGFGVKGRVYKVWSSGFRVGGLVLYLISPVTLSGTLDMHT